MPGRNDELTEPRSHLGPGGSWPTGPFLDDAPFFVAGVARMIERLDVARDQVSISEIARRTGLNRITVSKILNCGAWPEYVTLLKIHKALDIEISDTSRPTTQQFDPEPPCSDSPTSAPPPHSHNRYQIDRLESGG